MFFCLFACLFVCFNTWSIKQSTVIPERDKQIRGARPGEFSLWGCEGEPGGAH